MKILHIVPTYWPAIRYGGPIYSVHGLCAALVKAGCKVVVMTTSVDGNGNSQVEHGKAYYKDGVEIYYYPCNYLRRIYYSKALKHALEYKLTDFDLLHLHSIFLYPTNIAARIAYKLQVPYVLAPRGMLERELITKKSTLIKSIWLSLFERWTIEHAALLHLTSMRELDKLNQFNYYFPGKKVIPNGVDLSASSQQGSKPKDEVFQLLYIGRLSWKKQINLVIEALQYVEIKLKFTIAGNDEDNYRPILEKLIERTGVDVRPNIEIEFAGQVVDQAKLLLFTNADAMILTSISENFGNTVIEAMANACPVIVTKEVGTSEIVERSHCGLITTGTVNDIAEKIAYLNDNRDIARQMGINGLHEVRKKYAWDTVAATMIKTYSEILSKKYA